MSSAPLISKRQKRRLERFQKRFQRIYGTDYQGHWVFLLHAAFPIYLTPDLLYQIWFNFRLFPQKLANGEIEEKEIPNMVVSDLLLSGLCEEVGHELFEMDKDLRLYLLYHLQQYPHLGPHRLQLLAVFLRKYSQQAARYTDDPELRQLHQQIALATLNPRQAAREIGDSLTQAIRNKQANEQIRLTLLLELLAGQDEAFESLLSFTQQIKADLQGKSEQIAKNAVSSLVLSEEQTSDTVLTLPVPDRLKGKLQTLRDTQGESWLEAQRRIAQNQGKQNPVLNLAGLGLSSLPASLWELNHLETLRINNNKLSSLPPQIAQLVSLKTLNISRNRFKAIPEEIILCQNLQNLNAHHNDFADFPLDLLALSQLNKLDLGQNQLQELPGEIANLGSLRRLYLNHNQLSELPESLGELKDLQILQLQNNQLLALPESLRDLTSLRPNDNQNLWRRGFRIEGNPVSDGLNEEDFLAPPQELINDLLFPPAEEVYESEQTTGAESAAEDALAKAKALITEAKESGTEVLELNGLGLTELPEELWKLWGLKQLYLANNQLTEIPETIAQLQNLEELDLSGNPLQKLPNSLSDRFSLQFLELGHCRFSVFPTPILSLPRLQHLDLGHNALSEIPETIEGMKSLRRLFLHDNQLNRIPPTMGQITQLEVLQLHNNQIATLPDDLDELLDLKGNDDPEIQNRGFTIAGNPIAEGLSEENHREKPISLINLLLSGNLARRDRSQRIESYLEEIRQRLAEGNIVDALDKSLDLAKDHLSIKRVDEIGDLDRQYAKLADQRSGGSLDPEKYKEGIYQVLHDLLEWFNWVEKGTVESPAVLDNFQPDLNTTSLTTMKNEVLGQIEAGNLRQALAESLKQAQAYFNQNYRTEIIKYNARFHWLTDEIQRGNLDQSFVDREFILIGSDLSGAYETLTLQFATLPVAPSYFSQPGSPVLYALIIGIDHYAQVSTSLRGCKNDAQAVSQYIRRNLSGTPYGLEKMILLDSQATRENVLEGFHQHLSRAQSGDQILVYFAGYGSGEFAAKEWAQFEPDLRNETLVLYDSRTEGNFDLADKELSFLLSDISLGGADITVIIDAAHQVPVTQDPFEEATDRALAPKEGERPYESYYIPDEIRLSKAGLVFMPETPYYSLQACQADQTAVEISNRGAFTYYLLEVLQQHLGPISWQELVQKTTDQLQTLVSDQLPLFQTVGDKPASASFLADWLAAPLAKFYIHFDPEANWWRLNAGSEQGIVGPNSILNKVSQIAVFAPDASADDLLSGQGIVARGSILEVKDNESWVDVEEGLARDPEMRAPVRILSQPIFQLRYLAEQARLSSWSEEAVFYLSPEVDPDFAEYLLRFVSEQSQFELSRPDSSLPVIRTPDEDSLLRQMVHLAKWRNILYLRNPGSQIGDQDLQIRLSANEKGNIEPQPGVYELFLLDQWQGENLVLGNPMFEYQVAVHNQSSLPLYCSLLFFGPDFEVRIVPLDGAEQLFLEPNGSQWLELGFAFSPRREEMGWDQCQAHFKLIASPQAFAPEVLAMNPVYQEEGESKRAIPQWTNTHALLFDVEEAEFREWQTVDLSLTLRLPPPQGVELA
jgi:Leucine-rich repeat (LRR) protein